MKISIQGTGVELTSHLKEYYTDKIEGALSSFGSTNIDSVLVDLEIERTSNRHKQAEDLYRAEANVTVPGGMLRAEETAGSAHAAIDLMRDVLEREIRNWHKRQIQSERKGAREAKKILRSLDE